MSRIIRTHQQSVLLVLLLTITAVMQWGCQPKIGDDCIQDQNCSQMGDRICDTTQPGGYCTQFNCDPTSCPEKESICIAFANTPSTVAGCGNLGRTSPYARNFCMRSCEINRDCRDNYICIDLAEENPWGADVIQENPENTKVCVYPQSGVPIAEGAPDRANGVCEGASFASGGAGGSAGASAQ